ncbi:MAG: DUF1828 domain-containing protein [Candidatus Glassbacteria bacterium]|nr:DUF1828 domain-containing protein [Candidatus Glassbacteria bacterium]
MNITKIEEEVKKKICEKVHIQKEGIDRYFVSTPFTFSDGDHFVVLIKKSGAHWYLSDEGHTIMHLTYEMEENDLSRGTRNKIINTTLEQYGIKDNRGELRLKIENGEFGDSVFSFIQGLIKISDIEYLAQERAKSIFYEDFRRVILENMDESRVEFDWFSKERDNKKKYVVDCRINSMKRPLLIFALANEDKTRDATITLFQFEKWGFEFSSLGIFEDLEQINTKVVARYCDVGEKIFSNIESNESGIQKFLVNAI